jgi:type II secretory pathway component PulJ
MTSLPQHSQSGFTLIEVLVMTGLTVILLLSASAIFMTFLLNQSLVTQKQQIKSEGDNALKQMVQVLRQAKTIEDCQTGQDEITFTDVSNSQGRYYLDLDNNRIASASTPPTVYLTSDDLSVSNFSADCALSHESYLVKFQFTLSNNTPSFGSNPLEQTFEASVSLRN